MMELSSPTLGKANSMSSANAWSEANPHLFGIISSFASWLPAIFSLQQARIHYLNFILFLIYYLPLGTQLRRLAASSKPRLHVHLKLFGLLGASWQKCSHNDAWNL